MFYYPELSRRVKAVGFDGPVHDAVVSVAVALDMFDLTDEQKAVVFDMISTTGRRQLKALPERLIEGEWEDFNYGNVKIGDYVRIRPDAYDSPEGSKHNGLVGVLTRAAARRFFVEYLGTSYGASQYHPESSLQSLRWV